MVRLDGYGGRKPVQLSGGQRQRVALARSIVNRPKVLLLDEPLGALDLKLRQEMQVFLKALQRDLGITFVYVTHDQEEALTMSDRLAVFNQGRIEQIGARLRERLEAMAPAGSEVRGLGPMVAIELPEQTGDETARITAAARQQGLILLSCGLYGNVIRILVPFAIDDDDLERGLDILAGCVGR